MRLFAIGLVITFGTMYAMFEHSLSPFCFDDFTLRGPAVKGTGRAPSVPAMQPAAAPP
jgi:hypothetical protein